MRVIDIAIVACWAIFWLGWLAAAIGVRSGRTRWGQFAGTRVAIVILALFLVRLGLFRRHVGVTTSPWLQGTGLAAVLLGLGLAVWARVYIGRNWGMPMTEKTDPELVTTGPYTTIRHPIYSGIILAMAGTAIAVALYWLVAVAILAAYFIYSAVMEERYMTRQFPDQYPAYKRSTKMLIPLIF